MPYHPSPDFHKDYRVSLYWGVIRYQKIQEAYMPERVTRQYGFIQQIPRNPIQPLRVKRDMNPKSYILAYHLVDCNWASRYDHIQAHILNLPHASHGWDVANDYMEWFETCLHIKLLQASNTVRFKPIIQRAMPPQKGHNIYAIHIQNL
jgi:hypothetical protein